MATKQDKQQKEKYVLSAKVIFSWVLVVIFALTTISAIVQFMIVPALFFAIIAFMWSPYFDRWADSHNQKVTGWAKFIIMWVMLAILTFGGFYKGAAKELSSGQIITIILASLITWLVLRWMKKKGYFKS